jgi:hypothetical protein
MISAFLLGKVFPLLLKTIVGPLAYYLGRVLLNAWKSVDELRPGVKRIIVFAVALALSAAFQVTGQHVPGECSGLGAGQVADECVSILTGTGFLGALLTAAIGSGLAFLLHAERKAGA